MRTKLLLISTIFLSLLVSCEKAGKGDYADVAFTVSIPSAIETKANISDGSKVNMLHYVAFGPTGNVVLSGSTPISVSAPAVIEASLVKYVDYNFVFWAHKEDASNTNPVYDLSTFESDGKITVSYSGNANDEDRDAFYTNYPITLDDNTSLKQTVKLYRPFAQINFLHKDYKVVEDAGIHVGLTSMVEISGIHDVLDGKTGVASSSVTSVTTQLVHSAVPTEKFTRVETDPSTGVSASIAYAWYSMNYILCNETNDNIDVTGKFKYGQPENEVSVLVNSVPYKRNYRTNIIGSFLTEEAELTVEIVPGFVDDDNDGQPDDIDKLL